MCIDYSKLPKKLVRCNCAACITIDDPEIVHWIEEVDWEAYKREKNDTKISENSV